MIYMVLASLVDSMTGYKDQPILKIDKEEDDDYDDQQNQNRIESEGRLRVEKTETKKQEVVDMRRFKFFHFPVELMHFNFMRRVDGMELYRRIERL